MKIEYRTPAGSGAYTTLADESADSARISGFQPAFTKTTQIEPLFRSASPAVYDRGNALWRLRFTIDRTHSTPTDAAAHVLGQVTVWGAVAAYDLKITIGTTTMTMGNCVLTEFTPAPHSDATTLITYGFTGATFA